MSGSVIRIFSDVHFGDPDSRVQDLTWLHPLFEGADRLIFNGDTLDTEKPGGTERLSKVRTFFATLPQHLTVVTGNHDPIISPIGETSVAEGRVWITHGNVLFEDVAPWAGVRDTIHTRLAPLLAAVPPAERDLLATRHRLHRTLCVGLPDPYNAYRRGPLARVTRLIHTLFPPRRLLAMLAAWRNEAALADRFATRERPDARFILLGHTHLPTITRRPSGRIVINTGSYCPPWGARVVEIADGIVRVRAVKRTPGRFRFGRTVAEFPLAAAQPTP